jgi:hypothetical protein
MYIRAYEQSQKLFLCFRFFVAKFLKREFPGGMVATEETGAMGREIESRQGIGW